MDKSECKAVLGVFCYLRETRKVNRHILESSKEQKRRESASQNGFEWAVGENVKAVLFGVPLL